MRPEYLILGTVIANTLIRRIIFLRDVGHHVRTARAMCAKLPDGISMIGSNV